MPNGKDAVAPTAVELQLATETARVEVIAKCGRAIVHTLDQIRSRPEVRYQLGFGTKTFALLTEAAALLFNEPVEKIQQYYGYGE